MARLTEEQIKKNILIHLGAPVVEIHLQDCHLQEAIDEAKRSFLAKKGVQKTFSLDIVSSQSAYELPADVDEVLEVIFSESLAGLASIFLPFAFPDQLIPYSIFSAPDTLGVYSHYTQLLQYLEIGKRVTSAEQDWAQVGRFLHLFPVPSTSQKALIFYKSHTLTVEQLSERDNDLIVRYSRAYAKKILARIWGKYPEGFPTAQGSRSLNWTLYQQEGDAEIAALDEEIIMSSYPMPILVG